MHDHGAYGLHSCAKRQSTMYLDRNIIKQNLDELMHNRFALLHIPG